MHININHKKDLLRERKRHTDRGVSSTPYAVLSRGGGGGGRSLGVPPPPARSDRGGVGTLGYPLPPSDLAEV